MSPSKETVLIRRILARHGARSDLRLWRNESAGAWVGGVSGRTGDGRLVLKRGARQIKAGLCPGSADLVGLRRGGQFIGLEVKTEGVVVEPHQRRWLELIEELGGIAAVVQSVEDVDAVLGEPQP